ncbi:MAG: M1 family metallopeptidase, partial [Bacteroidia bacterium]|nr:M1 family metallopeptidase [Bacteroidia bacterium]
MNKFVFLSIFTFHFVGIYAQQIDTKHTALYLQFDWQKRQAFGIAKITFSPIETTSVVSLDAAELGVEKITFNGKSLQFQNNANNSSQNLTIQLGKSYSPADTLTLEISYHTLYENRSDPLNIGGSFGHGLRFMKSTYTTPNKHKQVWSSGEPEGNKYWFPCNENISDIHTTEIFVTVEKPLMALGNGTLVNTIEHKNGTQTFHYSSTRPFPNYLVSIVVGEYSLFTQKCATTQIMHYGYPQEMDALKATVNLLPDMLHFLEQKTGHSYPFQEYRQVVVQDYPFPGLVGQNGIGILSDNYIDDFGVHRDFQYLWDGVAIQAMANQWFGNMLMPKDWKDIWLNNAFAQYFAGLYTAKCHGNAEYLMWYHPFEKGAVLGDWNAGYVHPIVPDSIGDLGNFTGDNYSKFRGALVLRMLQHELGDSLWWKAVQYFANTHAYKQVSTADFINAIEKVSGLSYQWFFDQWLFKTGLPNFEVSTSYEFNTKQLQVHVAQVQDWDSLNQYPMVKYFQGSVGIEINNRIERVYVQPKQTNTFYFHVDSAPMWVNFNCESVFLAETKHTKTTESYLHQLKYSKDVLAKKEALNALKAIANDSLTTQNIKTAIENAFIAEIQSNQYWRWRQLVLGAWSGTTAQPFSGESIVLLKALIHSEQSWLKASAIRILGSTNDSAHLDIYFAALADSSDRVINAAAIAIGKTHSSKALGILMNLEHQKSWKNQNRISALNGLEQLGDSSAFGYALFCLNDRFAPRWYLATPTWDYPYAAVNTLVALGKGPFAYPLLFARLEKALMDADINDVFQNVQLIDLLRDERATEVYHLLKKQFQNDGTILKAIEYYENA